MSRDRDPDELVRIIYRPGSNLQKNDLPKWMPPERAADIYIHGKTEARAEVDGNWGGSIDFEATLKRNR